ncbi:HpcH/HpaI aldolase/citrate lyase family protein [Chelativorans salis]|uniref:CoA ester lyase n=1 Tax=Chelativorans salis TaxID=2978478 RepID=A0ABT2LN15_9HYPH|nr:CoA ester lyase [Chelativorans sp. EGI FJ00035]MCT7375706.1 CoA ester lyase [Chelativorans sp. EGI FJ00035]
MRSLLFVPGDSERKLEKALLTSADVLILDLEDSVAPGRKEAARRTTADFLSVNSNGPTLFYVRVNALSTGLMDGDLAAVMPARPAGIMLPKAEGGQDVTQLSVKLRVHEAESGIEDGVTAILPIITETAKAVFSAGTYAQASKRLSGLTWGAEDLSAEIGARTARDDDGRYTGVFALARATTLLSASAADVPAVDTVFPNFRDETGFARECLEAERDGFTAKMAIHPAQVPVINAAFTPSEEAVAQASRIVAAFEEAGETGVASVDGEMVDRPHLLRAERILERARLAGRG